MNSSTLQLGDCEETDLFFSYLTPEASLQT